MPVPLPRPRAVLLLFALAGRRCCSRPPLDRATAMASAGGSLYTQTNDPSGNAVQKFDARPRRLAHARRHVPDRRRRPGDARRPPGRRRAERRRPRAVRGQRRLRQRLGVPHRPPRPAAGRAASPRAASAPASIAEHRGRVYVLNSGGTPNVAAFWRRFDGSLAPIPGGTARARAGRAGRRAGLRHPGRPLARGQRARRQPARDAAARRPRPPRRAGRERLQRHGPVRVRHQPAAARSSCPRQGSSTVSSYRAGRPRRAAQHHRIAGRRPRRGAAGSPSRRRVASPTPATRPAASAASRSARDGSLERRLDRRR